MFQTNNKWTYGDAWEHFPIVPGEVWGTGESRVAVHNIFDPLPAFMNLADLLFIDPPWNLGNLNTFYTKAGRNDYQDSFSDFARVLFIRIAQIHPRVCFIEIGKQNVDLFESLMSELYPAVQRFAVTYYRKYPTYILRGGESAGNFDYTGIDEAKCIELIAKNEDYQVIGDLCMGRGLVGLAAYKAGKTFVGTELNQRRLACLLAGLQKLGADIRRFEA